MKKFILLMSIMFADNIMCSQIQQISTSEVILTLKQKVDNQFQSEISTLKYQDQQKIVEAKKILQNSIEKLKSINVQTNTNEEQEVANIIKNQQIKIYVRYLDLLDLIKCTFKEDNYTNQFESLKQLETDIRQSLKIEGRDVLTAKDMHKTQTIRRLKDDNNAKDKKIEELYQKIQQLSQIETQFNQLQLKFNQTQEHSNTQNKQIESLHNRCNLIQQEKETQDIKIAELQALIVKNTHTNSQLNQEKMQIQAQYNHQLQQLQDEQVILVTTKNEEISKLQQCIERIKIEHKEHIQQTEKEKELQIQELISDKDKEIQKVIQEKDLQICGIVELQKQTEESNKINQQEIERLLKENFELKNKLKRYEVTDTPSISFSTKASETKMDTSPTILMK